MKKIAIVGSPNVGKSTFFNKMIKKRISITEPEPGVTRDRIYFKAKWRDVTFELIDTGGLTFVNHGIEGNIHTQAEYAIEEADMVFFLLDGSLGITESDSRVGKILKKSGKEVVVLVNKSDKFLKSPETIYEFYKLGFNNVFAISAEHNRGFDDVMKFIYPKLKDKNIDDNRLNKEEIDKGKTENIKVAIVGRPNAGKSSLVNSLIGKDQNIVSNLAGTTRDTTSSLIEIEGNKIELLDTAGIRRKARVSENIEYYSVIRAVQAIRKADVVVILIDKEEGVTEQDQKIAGLASDAFKPIIIALNKIDLGKIEKDEIENIRDKLKFTNATVEKISALTKKGINNLLHKVIEVHQENHKRIPTGILNEVLKEIVLSHAPPSKRGKRIKINYATQVSVAPPRFLIFCNYPDLLHFSYVRRIEKYFRKAFGFEGVNMYVKIRKS